MINLIDISEETDEAEERMPRWTIGYVVRLSTWSKRSDSATGYLINKK